METPKLIGSALDWAVAKCEERAAHIAPYGILVDNGGYAATLWWRPSTDWLQGGPIIEREDIAVGPAKMCNGYRDIPGQSARAFKITGPLAGNSDGDLYGPTKLIAAMRCYVASKLGNEVEIPEELCK